MRWIRACDVAGATDVTACAGWGRGRRQKSTLKAKGSQKSFLEGHKNKAGMYLSVWFLYTSQDEALVCDFGLLFFCSAHFIEY